jgi:hypothetical protein
LAFRKAVNYEMSSRLLKRIETEESAQSSPQPIQKQLSVYKLKVQLYECKERM